MWNPRIGLTQDDYSPNLPVTVGGYMAQTSSPDPDKVVLQGFRDRDSSRPQPRPQGLPLQKLEDQSLPAVGLFGDGLGQDS